MADQKSEKVKKQRISSAEDLHNFMRVTSPKLWVLLCGILAVMIGVIVFSCFFTMENTVQTEAVVYTPDENIPYNIEISIPDSAYESAKIGMVVRIAGETGKVMLLYDDEVLGKGAMVELDDPYVLLGEGTYDAELVLESIKPIRFLTN